MCRAYLYKLMHSPLTYIAVFATAGICAFQLVGQQVSYNLFGTVVYHMEMFLYRDEFRRVITVFGALPFAANFADEWTSGAAMSLITRRGARRYAIANVMFCGLSALVVIFAGCMLFCGVYSLFIPFAERMPVNHGNGLFAELFDSGLGEIYLTLRLFLFAAGSAQWAVMGMLMTALFPSRYVAICVPFAANHLIEWFSMLLPDKVNLYYLTLFMLEWKSDLAGTLWTLGVFAAMAAVCGAAFCFIVERRVRCEFA